MALYLGASRKDAQEKIEELRKKGKLSFEWKILHKEGKVWIPVSEKMPGAMEMDGEPLLKKPRSLDEALSGILSAGERREVVGSFDLIGDIAVIEVPETLAGKEKEIAQGIMRVHKNVKVVAKKEGPMEGAFRTRKLKIILGEKRTETTHIENGVRMRLDVAKAYFSPRLSFERKRIAGLVREGEKILALFAGVGPFPLVIAREKKGCEIVAIELNPEAVRYMRKNVALNKASGVKVVEGDVAEIVPRDYADFADRVLMPLPKDAEHFLKSTYAGAKNRAVVHFYTFVDIKNPFGNARAKIFAQLGKDKVEILNERVVRPFSPALVQVCVDFRIKK